jgi:NAD(P)-dependent dehydrogenase (short-subunit alcohol dehydrogenase family)
MLKDKVIVITGGLGLLGKNLALELINQGAIVIITDIMDKNKVLNQLNLKEKHNLEYIQMDITSLDSIQNCIKYVSEKYKKIDALINSAYPRNKNYGRKFEEVTYEDFCENVNMHLGGYFLISQQFALYFKKQGYGNIINISSIYGVIPPRFEIYEGTNMTMPVEYAAVKSAIIHLTKYMAKYFRGYNIRFNCVSPGGILDNQPEIFLKNYKKYCLNKGMLDVEDVIGSILFLLSDESKFINGQNIVVDDGFSL